MGLGVSSVNNAAAFTNGTDTETDEQLREPGSELTVLRNIAVAPMTSMLPCFSSLRS